MAMGMPPAGGCEAARSAVTLMVYMCGSDLESRAGAATQDLEELMAAMPADGSVEIVALLGGSTGWKSAVNADSADIYRLTPQGLELAEAGGPGSMGSAGTLGRLLRYGHDACPAERYALLMWDHGAGPMMGLCFDERHSGPQGMDALSLTELRTALAESPFAGEKLAWIGFDACLMASVETACVVAPYAEYMIASQETEPVDGWCYDFISDLAGDASGAQTGRRIVDSYAAYYAQSLSDITLSCVDLSRMEAVEVETSELFGGLDVDAERYAAYARGRNEARSIGSGPAYAYDLVDIEDLVEVYEQAGVLDGAALRAALEAAVVCNYANAPFHNGLSLYYPFANKARFASPWASMAEEIDFAEGYRAFIRKASAIWLGESLADWKGTRPIATNPGDRSMLSTALTDEQAAQLAEARLLVMEETQPGKYRVIFDTDDVTLRENQLYAAYSEEALYLTDESGAAKSGSMFYIASGEDIYTLAIMYLPEEGSDAPNPVGAVLRYRPDGVGAYRFVEALEIREDGLGGKSTLRPENCARISVTSRLRTPVWDGEGRLLPYDRWDYTEDVTGDTFVGETLEKLAFFPLNDGEPRWAMFEITDLQGNVWTSELTPLSNEYRSDLQLPAQTLLDCEACEVTLEKVESVIGAYPSLDVTYSVVNRGNREIYVTLDDFQFDDTLLIASPSYSAVFMKPGERRTCRMRIDAERFREGRIGLLEQMAFDVSCTDCESFEHLGENRAALALKLDTRLLTPDAPEPEELDGVEWNGLRIELAEVVQPYGGGLQALVHFVNPGDTQTRFGFEYEGYRLNDAPVVGHFDTSKFELPGHCDTYLMLNFYQMEDGGALPESVESIGFVVYGFEEGEYGFTEYRDARAIRLEPGKGE